MVKQKGLGQQLKAQRETSKDFYNLRIKAIALKSRRERSNKEKDFI